MAVPQRFSDQQMFDICERLYKLNGFVKWADVGRALGVSRQAIQLRLRAAQARGDLDDATYDRWSSMTARAAASRESRAKSRERDRERHRDAIRLRLSPENAAWLRAECVLRKVTSADLINGMITREREAARS